MFNARPAAAIVLCFSMALPGFGQTQQTQMQTPQIYGGAPTQPILSWFARDYLPRPVRAISWADSPRIEQLMRAGNIYLSLRDAIALALENNLDIENARFNLPQADANLLRAESGNLLTNVSNSVSQGPSSASSGVLAGAGGFGAVSAGGGSGGGGQQGVLSGLNVQLAGTAIPALDPSFYTNGQFSHQTTPLTSAFSVGTNFLVTSYKSWNYGIQKGFLTGTNVSLGMQNVFGYWQNAPNNDFNPSTNANLGITVSQNLIKGCCISLNNRVIRVAKNQLKISDLTFEQQIMATVSNVANLYWDLALFNNNLRIRQQALELNTKLYEDNKRRAELGAIAPIDIIQAEAEMKGAQQDVKTAESQVLQQETILKSVLLRSGLDNLAIATARIVPTDHFDVPQQESVQPIQDLIGQAMQNRPDVAQSRLGLEDTRISMSGTKNALLPSLQVFAQASNTGQAGSVNDIPAVQALPSGGFNFVPHDPTKVNQFFLGGYGTVLAQLLSRNFPNYAVGFSFNLPLRNRSAQADLIVQQLQYRQQQIQDKQLSNNIKVNVLNSQTALTQARAAWENAVEARRLQEETQRGTRRKYELGTATILDVVITQQTTVARELSEANALNQYVHARINLQNILGNTLDVYNVSIEDARKGAVGRAPDPIPAVPGGSAAAPRAPIGLVRK
ncbi:MAG: TolC family protein [Acidobacteriia bacterium]|nr:TolC family protein [Terriglobia bacterium]